jgi:D-threo-aldose 1-dehydrogenase
VSVTPIDIPRGIGFGGASIGNLRRAISDDEARAAVDRAWERGVRYFDTAPHYGLGLSERRLGAALSTRPRNEYVISTKAGRLLKPRARPLSQDDDGFAVPGDLERVWNFSLAGVRRSLEESASRLGIERIDVLFAHDPDQAGAGAANEGLAALAELKREGLVAAVGVGTNALGGLDELIADGLIDVLMLANRWTLLDHSDAIGVMSAAATHGTTVVTAGVFNTGLLATRRPRPDAHYDYGPASRDVVARANRLADVCEDHGITLPAAAIAFAALPQCVASVVLGMRSAADVDANLDRYAEDVPRGLWRALIDEGLVDELAIPKELR